ncbi:diguanylate cyclase [Gallaecimonas kandeliae]|uniref:GGDEF domain-containing protein n=1 Tax=Gallaecimonas kandeliae TaxID=3029055 RepID=UPI0026491BFC|nr:diguanylate cyclase [Gallaecimonas kandeliae]WKE67344.1 diguanylate cyclase [Gallaecimonas kandeliae]
MATGCLPIERCCRSCAWTVRQRYGGKLEILVEHVTHSSNGIAVLDKDDKFIFYNRTFISLFGLEEHPVLGHSFNDLLLWMHAKGVGANTHGATTEEWLEFVHGQFRSVSFRHFEVDLVDGRWLLMTEQLNKSGEVVLVCNDITGSKETEQALRRAQKELERLALTDELTNVPNRRHFMQQLGNEHQRALRHRHPTSLAAIDLDHFKKINDLYGHASGRCFPNPVNQSA